MNNFFFTEAFEKKFSFIKDKKIALYGIGYFTKVILDNFSNSYNIIGIIDKEKYGEIIYNRVVMKIEEAVKASDVIIIVSNLSSSDIIYRRIKPFTDQYNIQVYYTNGEMPESYDERIGSDPYWKHTESELIGLIEKYDIISFDIFDTIIIRKYITPESVLEEVGCHIKEFTGQDIDFPELHRRAILDCNKHNKFFDLNMIYSRLSEMQGWDDTICQEIKEKELELEVSNAMPREYAVRLMRMAKAHNKFVILTSDMYIHTEDICRVLSACGIKQGDDYDEIYISCDIKASKYKGTMYEYLKKTYPNKSILHIGDNVDSDFNIAKECGIEAFHLRSPIQLYEASGLNKVIGIADDSKNPEEKGTFIRKAFNDPFWICEHHGKLFIDNMYDLGNLFIAPILTYYVQWIIEISQKNHIEKLLFVSRDGYLLKKIYDEITRIRKINNTAESYYFLTSRRAASVPCIKSDDDIRYIINNLCKTSDMQFYVLLKSVFGVECDNNDSYSKKYLYEMDRKTLVDIITNNYREKILQNSKKEAECYRHYINRFNSFNHYNVGLVNLVGQGLTQKFVEELTGLSMHGLYLATEPALSEIYDKQTNNISAALGFELSPYTSHFNSVNKYLFLETVLTAPYGCLERFDENGNPIYADDMSEFINEILKCHEGVMEYVRQYSGRTDLLCSDKLFGTFTSHNVIISDEVKKCFLISDLYGGNKKRNLL